MGQDATKSLPFRTAYSLLEIRPILPKAEMPEGLLMGMPMAGQFVSLELYSIRLGSYGAYRLRFSAARPKDEWELRGVVALEVLASLLVTFAEPVTEDRAIDVAMEFHRVWTTGELCADIRKQRDGYPMREDAAGMRWVGVMRV